MGGRGSKAESNLICLFQRVGMNEKQIKEVFEHIYFLWDRDKNTRTHSVHFFVNRELKYSFLSNTHSLISCGKVALLSKSII